MEDDIFSAVTNIPSPAYYDFIELIGKISGKIGDKRLVLYGCGTQGCVLLTLLEQNGIENFMFTDSNESFHGRFLRGHPVIAPGLIYESPENHIVFVTPQDDAEIIRSLEKRGFSAGRNLYSAGNAVYRLFLEEFSRGARENELLLLGDCAFLHCSLQDSDKTDLTTMLKSALFPPPPQRRRGKTREYKGVKFTGI